LCTVVRTDDGPRCVLSSRSDALSWPFGAAVGALVVLLSVSRLERDRAERSSADDRSAVAAAD
jgi:hypothetical protein